MRGAQGSVPSLSTVHWILAGKCAQAAVLPGVSAPLDESVTRKDLSPQTREQTDLWAQMVNVQMSIYWF